LLEEGGVDRHGVDALRKWWEKVVVMVEGVVDIVVVG
jgi:hypothetical protein